MDLKPGYQQTELGVIPEDWEVHELGELRPFVTSGSRGWADYYSQYGDLFVRITNLTRESIYLDLADCKFVKLPQNNSEGVRTQLCNNDVLISITADIGIIGYIDDNVPKPAYINQHIALVRLDPEVANARFVSYYLASVEPQKKFQASTDTGAKAGMSLAGVQKIKTLLPPTIEQSAIANALSDVDALLAVQDALIEKKRAIKQGAMQELLTGKRRLPGFVEAWKVKTLDSLLESPVTDGPHLTPKFFDRGIPFLSVNNLVDGKIDWSDLRYISYTDHQEFSRKCRPRLGDILFGKAASVGKVALVETESEFNIWSPIALIRIDRRFSNRFVCHQLQSKFVEEQVLLLTNSSSQGNIGMSDIERLQISMPATRDEQVAVAEMLDDLDCEIAALEAKRTKTALLKQGMMQELLTGKTRLV